MAWIYMALLTKLFALQKLGLQGNLKSLQSFGDPSLGPGALDSYVIVVTEDEQADVYCCWAESALLKFRCLFTSTQKLLVLLTFHSLCMSGCNLCGI